MKRIVVLIIAFICLAGQVFAQASLQNAAVVNLTRSEAITVGQLRERVTRIESAFGRPLNALERREALDSMINERLVLQAAARDRITVTDNELNQRINELRSQMVPVLGRQPTDAEFAAAVREQTGLGMNEFREETRRQITLNNYILTQQRSLFESIRPPTESEIAGVFELTRSQFVRPATVRLSMIQVPYGADAASRTRARQQIDTFAREIGTSSSRFDEVIARERGTNPSFQGGDVGFLPRMLEVAQRMGQEFVDTAFNLRLGEISRVIEGPVGYQLLKVTESHAMRNLELDDIFQLGTPMTVRAYIGNVMIQERQNAALAQAMQAVLTDLRAGGRTFQIFEANLNW
jgi:parvulin-like peptidyl-prolyl isomerase